MPEPISTPGIQTFPRSQKRITLGRDPSCDVCLRGVGSSRFHAIVFCDETGVWIQDSNSTFGVRVDNVPVRKAQIENGNVITAGVVRFKISFDASDISFSPVRDFETDFPRTITTVDDAGDATTIGRDPSNKICLPHPLVSRFHATVFRKNGTLTVVDHGSTNATFINGGPAHRKNLDDGDVIQIGPYRLFVSGGTLQQAQALTVSK